MTQNSLNKWTEKDFKTWKDDQVIQRSYTTEVISKIKSIEEQFKVHQYGSLAYDKNSYPLYLLQSLSSNDEKPNILITGGVHGYETSGVHGALKFMEKEASKFEDRFNFICIPCISPWGYETINRWNPDAIDPNRNFFKNSPAKECAHLYTALDELGLNFLAHFDLHETTDTDNTVFRPLLEKRDGVPQPLWEIPDGFYLVGDTTRVEDEFQKAIIAQVADVTHIAPSDKEDKIIGVDTQSEGVINYDVKKLYLCAGLTDAKFVTTTEVYPDSPKVTAEDCDQAQVAAIIGGLNYLISNNLA